MADQFSHRITITVTGSYMHGKESEHCTVTLAGNGSLDHAVNAFKAALVAMTFSPETAAKLTLGEGA